MATVHPFPNQSVRALVHSVIQMYAAGKWTRQQMMSQVHDTLRQYGISRLNINNYNVRIVEPVITSAGVFPVVIIEGGEVSASIGCPACHSREAGYLAGDSTVTVMCRSCGCIYQFRERKEGLK
ncbi:hypothetical protein [Desulforamulus hydrothermalis]|uniref:hypothetical protein n=1 Tax=Desulforamulus hydrothermalis TaxID=412895 RepID=UPI0006628DC6|nr:hypothetical protein [Desulforamulus hydrothermalis]SHH43573.1 hypothetical protein SAMN02745177_02547 [Desulforamulus hydrothermalis Lam5 = DSM 18033]